MRKFFFIFFFLAPGLVFAEWETKVDEVANILFGSNVRKIFGQVWPGARVEVSHPLKWGVHTWAGADFFHVRGNLIGYDNDLALTYVPVGMGLKFKAKVFSRLDAYLGGGPRLGVLSIQNETRNTRGIHSSLGWGMTGFAGVNLAFSENMLFDLMSNLGFTTYPNTGLSGPVPHLHLSLRACDIAAGLQVKF